MKTTNAAQHTTSKDKTSKTNILQEKKTAVKVVVSESRNDDEFLNKKKLRQYDGIRNDVPNVKDKTKSGTGTVSNKINSKNTRMTQRDLQVRLKERQEGESIITKKTTTIKTTKRVGLSSHSANNTEHSPDTEIDKKKLSTNHHTVSRHTTMNHHKSKESKHQSLHDHKQKKHHHWSIHKSSKKKSKEPYETDEEQHDEMVTAMGLKAVHEAEQEWGETESLAKLNTTTATTNLLEKERSQKLYEV